MTGRILFTSGKDDHTEVWCLDLATNALTQLTSGPGRNEQARWSPDGTRIVYVSNESPPSALWIATADGRERKRLTEDDHVYCHPGWSPDGRWIVCSSDRGGEDTNSLWLYDVAAGTWRPLTDAAAYDSFPAFAPDGRRIAFSSTRSGNEDIWVYESRQLTQLTSTSGRDFAPAWSPNGELIAFVADRAVSPRDRILAHPDLDVWVMKANGAEQRRLTTNQGTDRCVAWSPDGKHLVYSSTRNERSGERLSVISVEGGSPERVGVRRKALEVEIEAEPIRLFSFLPEPIVRLGYPSSFFGSETYPDWAA